MRETAASKRHWTIFGSGISERLAERQVRRIEKGGRTTIEALRRLASAHRMDLAAYLNELAANIPYPAALKRVG